MAPSSCVRVIDRIRLFQLRFRVSGFGCFINPLFLVELIKGAVVYYEGCANVG